VHIVNPKNGKTVGITELKDGQVYEIHNKGKVYLAKYAYNKGKRELHPIDEK